MLSYPVILANLAALLALGVINGMQLGGPIVQDLILFLLYAMVSLGYTLHCCNTPKLRLRAARILAMAYLCLAMKPLHHLYPLYTLILPPEMAVQGVLV